MFVCDGAPAPLEMTLQHSAGAGVGMPVVGRHSRGTEAQGNT